MKTDELCKHNYYHDRTVTIDGKRYKVMRCSKCGAEKYILIK